MALEFTTSYVKDTIDTMRHYKRLAERALDQVPDEALFFAPADGSNSIAIIMKHLSGNLLSRWKDFLTTDGEKPDRDRDSEFEDPLQTRAEMLKQWEQGWDVLLGTLSTLTDADLGRTVMIRGEAHSVLQAITRQNTHTAYHIGQIVYLAKQFAGEQWKILTVPRKKSGEYNSRVRSGELSQR
jgi:hypothetical protein